MSAEAQARLMLFVWAGVVFVFFWLEHGSRMEYYASARGLPSRCCLDSGSRARKGLGRDGWSGCEVCSRSSGSAPRACSGLSSGRRWGLAALATSRSVSKRNRSMLTGSRWRIFSI